mgnify:CR=1 FL=1
MTGCSACVSGSAACCAHDLVFESPHETLTGLREIKYTVFDKAAPAPTKILRRLTAGTFYTVDNGRGPVRVTPYVREFEVKRPGTAHLKYRHELHLRNSINADGKPTGKGQICKIVVQTTRHRTP